MNRAFQTAALLLVTGVLTASSLTETAHAGCRSGYCGPRYSGGYSSYGYRGRRFLTINRGLSRRLVIDTVPRSGDLRLNALQEQGHAVENAGNPGIAAGPTGPVTSGVETAGPAAGGNGPAAPLATPPAADGVPAAGPDSGVTPPPAAAVDGAVPEELRAILGLWESKSTDAEGQVSSIELNLQETGDATLTVQAAGISPVSVTRKFAVNDGLFTLGDGEGKLTLGKVVSADADQVVLDAAAGRLTLTRP